MTQRRGVELELKSTVMGMVDGFCCLCYDLNAQSSSSLCCSEHETVSHNDCRSAAEDGKCEQDESEWKVKRMRAGSRQCTTRLCII